jgi:hypothetical protein
MSLFLGMLMTALILARSGHPIEYLAYTVVAWTVVAFLPGLVFAPLLMGVYASHGKLGGVEPSAIGAFGSILGVYPAFWLLSTPIGFYEPAFSDLVSLAKQTLFWGGLGVALTLIWWRLFAFRPLRVVMLRSTSIGAPLLLGLCGLWVYPLMMSRSLELEIEPTASLRPNIIIVLVDTLRADHLSVYGYDLPTSPNIDSFAKDATIYWKAFAPAPWTRPSCASLLTSLYPQEAGMREMSATLPAEVPILPQFSRQFEIQVVPTGHSVGAASHQDEGRQLPALQCRRAHEPRHSLDRARANPWATAFDVPSLLGPPCALSTAGCMGSVARVCGSHRSIHRRAPQPSASSWRPVFRERDQRSGGSLRCRDRFLR